MPDQEGILRNLQQDDDGFISVTGFDKNSAQAALIEHEKYLCMAFRGTDELIDWLDNLDVVPTKHLYGEFHRGFWESVEDLWEGIISKYHELQNKRSRPLFITGHSLGGAMATIAAARLVHENKSFVSVYTFGQPRAMKLSASRVFNAKCKTSFFRFHNNNDVVTRLPSILSGYSHVGTHLYISEHRIIYQKTDLWFIFFDSISGILNNLINNLKARGLNLDMIKDHDMVEYLKAICKWDLRA